MVGRGIAVGDGVWGFVDSERGKIVGVKVGEVGVRVDEFGWAPAARVFSVERGGEAGMGVVLTLASVHPRRMSKVSNGIHVLFIFVLGNLLIPPELTFIPTSY
jgi:hypothetical protein